MPYAPTLTPYTDAAPCPRVEVFFEEFAPGTDTVTVYRSAAGREYEVRGAVRAATAGSLTRIDFECPFNIPVTYRAEMFDDAGLSLGFTDPGTMGDIVVLEGDVFPEDDEFPEDDVFPGELITFGVGLISGTTWLHNPLRPEGAVAVVLSGSTGTTLSRPVPGSVSYPLGRRVGVMLTQPRRGVSRLRFDVRVFTLEDADKVQALVGDDNNNLPPVICVRLGGDEQRLRIPQPMFLGVQDIVEESINVFWGGEDTRQLMEGDEVAPPIPGLFIPLLTNADLNAYYASNAALNSDNASNVAVNRRYDLAGFAGA